MDVKRRRNPRWLIAALGRSYEVLYIGYLFLFLNSPLDFPFFQFLYTGVREVEFLEVIVRILYSALTSHHYPHHPHSFWKLCQNLQTSTLNHVFITLHNLLVYHHTMLDPSFLEHTGSSLWWLLRSYKFDYTWEEGSAYATVGGECHCGKYASGTVGVGTD